MFANGLGRHIVYESPQVDMGYDIADYRAIHAPYGTMENVEALIEGLHDRDMKFVMDLVVNHTSDQVRNTFSSVINTLGQSCLTILACLVSRVPFIASEHQERLVYLEEASHRQRRKYAPPE